MVLLSHLLGKKMSPVCWISWSRFSDMGKCFVADLCRKGWCTYPQAVSTQDSFSRFSLSFRESKKVSLTDSSDDKDVNRKSKRLSLSGLVKCSLALAKISSAPSCPKSAKDMAISVKSSSFNFRSGILVRPFQI